MMLRTFAILAAAGLLLAAWIAGYRNRKEFALLAALTAEGIADRAQPDAIFYLDHNFGEREEAADKINKWWPDRKVVSTSLPQEPFARATLNVLKHWETFSLPTPRECREIF